MVIPCAVITYHSKPLLTASSACGQIVRLLAQNRKTQHKCDCVHIQASMLAQCSKSQQYLCGLCAHSNSAFGEWRRGFTRHYFTVHIVRAPAKLNCVNENNTQFWVTCDSSKTKTKKQCPSEIRSSRSLR